MKYGKLYFTKQTTKESKVYKKYQTFLQDTGIRLKNKSICDIGCATGVFIENIIGSNDCYGVDISKFAIEKCKTKFPNIKKNFMVQDLNEMSLVIKKEFDVITMFDVIEHLYNFEYIKKMIDVNLKRGGYLVVTTPNANSLLRFFSRENFTGEMDTTHTVLFTPYTLDFFLSRLKIKKIALFTPYTFSFKNNFFSRNLMYGGQIVAIYKK